MVNEACLKMLDTYKVLHIGVSLNYRGAAEMAKAKLRAWMHIRGRVHTVRVLKLGTKELEIGALETSQLFSSALISNLQDAAPKAVSPDAKPSA
jgi:phosphate-selective porin